MAETPRQEESEKVLPSEQERINERFWLGENSSPESMLTFAQERIENDNRRLFLFSVACFERNEVFKELDQQTQSMLEAIIEAAKQYVDYPDRRQELTSLLEQEQVPIEVQRSFQPRNPWVGAYNSSNESMKLVVREPITRGFNSPERLAEKKLQTDLLRDIFHNPFAKEPIELDPNWRTSTVVELANTIYHEKAFDRMPVLADALEDAGCTNQEVLDHCRKDQGADQCSHVRGCWVVDLILGKE